MVSFPMGNISQMSKLCTLVFLLLDVIIMMIVKFNWIPPLQKHNLFPAFYGVCMGNFSQCWSKEWEKIIHVFICEVTITCTPATSMPGHGLFLWTSKIRLVKHWSHPKRSKKSPTLIMNSYLMTWHHYQHCQSVTLLPLVSRSRLLKEFTMFIMQFPAHMISRRSHFD